MRAARGGFCPSQRKENQIMQFQKGQSGNPAGRPRGSRNKTTVLMQNLLEGEAEAIARKAIEMAKDGDMAAIRVCMDRLASIRRKDPIAFELPPMDKARDTVAAVAAIERAANMSAPRTAPAFDDHAVAVVYRVTGQVQVKALLGLDRPHAEKRTAAAYRSKRPPPVFE